MAKWRDAGRMALLVGVPGGLIWLGHGSAQHIAEMYDGLCPIQGQGLCAGIGDDLYVLRIITWVAGIAAVTTIVLWWKLWD